MTWLDGNESTKSVPQTNAKLGAFSQNRKKDTDYTFSYVIGVIILFLLCGLLPWIGIPLTLIILFNQKGGK